MKRSAQVSAVAYGVALASLAAAVLVRWLLDPVLGDALPLTTLFAAVGTAIWIGGYRPAFLVAVLGYLACDYLFISPRGQLGLSGPRDLASLFLYLTSAAIIIGFGEALFRARQDSRQRGEPVHQGVEPLRATLIGIGDEAIRLKESENALRASEERSAFVRRTSGVGFWYCDLPFDVLQWDELVKAHFHLPPNASVTIQTFYERIHPDDREPTRLAIEQSIASRTPYDTDYRTVDPVTDAITWVRAIGRTFYAADGTPNRFDGVTLDVSDRKRAEQEVVRLASESELQRRLYETVLTNTPDLAYVFDLNHRFTYANHALLTMWGKSWEESIGKTCIELGYERWHAEMHDREIEQVVATKQPIRGEVAFVGTNGRRQYDYIFVPVIGTDGEVEAVAGTTRDVTERKIAEERQAFLIKLADTLRPLSDPSIVQAEASRVLGEQLGANRVVYFEISGDEYVVERDYTSGVRPLAGRYPIATFGSGVLAVLLDGRTIIEADATTEPERPPDEQAAFAAIQVRGHVDVPLVKGGRFVAGMTVHVSNRRDWTLEEVALIEDTAERTWAAVERARAEREIIRLATSAERERRLFAAVLANVPDFIYTFDLNGRFVYVNAALLTLLGKRLDEAVGRNFFNLDYPPALADRLQRQIQQVIDTKQPLRDETPYTSGLGERIYEYIFTPVVRSGDVVEAVAGVTRDITDRKAAEEEKEQLVAQLRDQDRRKDEFLATLAHELRNPLAPIRNGLHVMKLAGVSGTIEQARMMMERQLTQLIRLVDDLLDVSRVTSGKLELRRERVELRAVIDAAIETTRPVIEQAGHRLTVVLPDEPIILDGDPTRLAQIVSNLLNNSAKYTPRGGRVRLAANREDGMAVLVIADNGIGMPPNMLDKVFEMFSQVDRTLEKTTGGLGIGLSLVKGLVEMHGGTIEAHSDGEARGSEFILRLPVALSEVQKFEPAVAAEPVGVPRHRVLVADDSVDSAESLGKLLELLGNDVSTANDGLQAVDLAESFRPNIILLDIGMPKLNGYEACRRIREQPWGKTALIVAMTGWGQEEDKRRSHEAGFDLHLVKPVEPGALAKLLLSLKSAPPIF